MVRQSHAGQRAHTFPLPIGLGAPDSNRCGPILHLELVAVEANSARRSFRLGAQFTFSLKVRGFLKFPHLP